LLQGIGSTEQLAGFAQLKPEDQQKVAAAAAAPAESGTATAAEQGAAGVQVCGAKGMLGGGVCGFVLNWVWGQGTNVQAYALHVMFNTVALCVRVVMRVAWRCATSCASQHAGACL
jgi:hypothetical protein